MRGVWGARSGKRAGVKVLSVASGACNWLQVERADSRMCFRVGMASRRLHCIVPGCVAATKCISMSLSTPRQYDPSMTLASLYGSLAVRPSHDNACRLCRPQTGPHATQLRAQAERYSKLRGIITGVTPISLYLEFLSSHNHADRQARAAERRLPVWGSVTRARDARGLLGPAYALLGARRAPHPLAASPHPVNESGDARGQRMRAAADGAARPRGGRGGSGGEVRVRDRVIAQARRLTGRGRRAGAEEHEGGSGGAQQRVPLGRHLRQRGHARWHDRGRVPAREHGLAHARDQLGQVQRDRRPGRHPPRPPGAGAALRPAARRVCRGAGAQ